MLYGTEGGGHGQKSKYTVLPRVCRVKFDFSYRPAGWPSKIWFFELSCRAAESNWQAGQGRSIRRPDEAAVGGRVRSPDRSAEAGLSIGRGRPAGEFEKQNFKRPPGRTIRYEKSNFMRQTRGRTVYFDFWPSPPPSVPYGLCTSLRPKWSFQDQGNGTLIGIDDVWVKKKFLLGPGLRKCRGNQ